MTPSNIKQKPTRKELEQKVRELEAQLVHRCYFASQAIEKAGTKYLSGSGVIISFAALGGREITEPVCIRDGLSAETIAALKSDFARSYEIATIFKLEQAK
jgi:hypothetical protein